MKLIPLFLGLLLAAPIAGAQAYGNTGFDLTISTIPEPSTVLALVMAVAAGVPALRRRRP
ncbi:MAG TPA: PEP-CTERM sorting domain-containing protein [Verrucomicrobiae bacterium]|nr:PEP-CTERM sorting domain-containing protein [Verrucomicrobiae bacterium]